MAYNYNLNPTSVPQQNQIQQQAQPQMMFQQQNVQPLFPQPQGNVYNINSTLEVANVPVGAGISVALCLPENVMYIKTMQNGNPLFYPYKIVPYTNEEQNSNQQTNAPQENDSNKQIIEQLQQCNLKINQLEEDFNSFKTTLSKKPQTQQKEGGWNI